MECDDCEWHGFAKKTKQIATEETQKVKDDITILKQKIDEQKEEFDYHKVVQKSEFKKMDDKIDKILLILEGRK